MRAWLEGHDRIVRSAIEGAGGYLFATGGDAYSAAFASPTAAVQAAIETQAKLMDLDGGDAPIRVRMAIHIGAADERDGDYYGPTLNRTARLLAAANGRQVLVSLAAVDRLRNSLPDGAWLVDLGEHRLKDLSRPEQVYRLVHSSFSDDNRPLRSLDAFSHNLPGQLTSFVGREHEVAEVAKLLAGSRIITLVGAGGSGKTRLALQVARERLSDFPDGAWFVDLTKVGDSDRVATAVQSALGVKVVGGQTPLEAIVDGLSDRRVLIVLDNCEHVVDGAAGLMLRLAQETDEVVLLATSRQPVGLIGEIVHQVPPLEVPPPPPMDVDGEDLLTLDSVRLFYERAGDAGVDLDLSTHGRDVVEVCRQVAGLPLAIELAAGRLSALSPKELAERLSDQLRLLRMDLRAGDLRHSTLERTIDWSWQLLAETEQFLLARLSVFRGGWSLDAAEEVCGTPPIEASEVFELLSDLVGCSLVVTTQATAGVTRYWLLEPIRQFAERQLEPDQLDVTRKRHAGYFQSLAKGKGASQFAHVTYEWFSDVLPRLRLDEPNMEAAVEFNLDRSWYEQAVETIAWGLFYIYWLAGGHFDQIARWTSRLVAAGDEVDPRSLIQTLRTSGAIASASGRNEAWLDYMNSGMQVAISIDDKEAELQCVQWGGEAMSRLGRFGEAQDHFDHVRANAQDPFLRASASLSLAKGLRGRGMERWQMAEEALVLADAETWAPGRGYTPEVAAYLLARVAEATGHYNAASRLLQRSRELSKAIGFRLMEALSTARLAVLLSVRGQNEDALSVLGKALAVAREMYWSRLVRFFVLQAASEVHRRSGDLGKAHDYASRACESNYQPGEAVCALHLARVVRDQGKLEEAEALCECALAKLSQVGSIGLVPYVRIEQASIALRKGRPVESIGLIKSSMEENVDLEYPYILEGLETLAIALIAEENPESAALLLGAVDRQRRDIGVVVPAPERQLNEEAIRKGRGAHDDVTWDEAFGRGATLGFEPAVEQVLGLIQGSDQPESP